MLVCKHFRLKRWLSKVPLWWPLNLTESSRQTMRASHAFGAGFHVIKEGVREREWAECLAWSVLHLERVYAQSRVCLTLPRTLRSYAVNWNITELGYKCLTQPCVYSINPDTAELNTYFLLISFSFASLWLESVWIRVTCEGILSVC